MTYTPMVLYANLCFQKLREVCFVSLPLVMPIYLVGYEVGSVTGRFVHHDLKVVQQPVDQNNILRVWEQGIS